MWYPEIRLFQNDAQQRAAWQHVVPRERRRWVSYVVLFLYCALGVPACKYFAGRFVSRVTFLPAGTANWVGPLIFIAGGAGVGLFGGLWSRRRVRTLLREHLVGLGVPVCVHCGYDLRGQTMARCPECGRSFDSRLLGARCSPPESALDDRHD